MISSDFRYRFRKSFAQSRSRQITHASSVVIDMFVASPGTTERLEPWISEAGFVVSTLHEVTWTYLPSFRGSNSQASSLVVSSLRGSPIAVVVTRA